GALQGLAIPVAQHLVVAGLQLSERIPERLVAGVDARGIPRLAELVRDLLLRPDVTCNIGERFRISQLVTRIAQLVPNELVRVLTLRLVAVAVDLLALIALLARQRVFQRLAEFLLR